MSRAKTTLIPDSQNKRAKAIIEGTGEVLFDANFLPNHEQSKWTVGIVFSNPRQTFARARSTVQRSSKDSPFDE